MYLLSIALIPLLLFYHSPEIRLAPIEFMSRYSVMTGGLGEAGNFSTDRTTEPPRLIIISRLPDDGIIRVSKNISDYLLAQPDVPEIIEMGQIADHRYKYRHGETDTTGTVTVWLNTIDDVLQGEEQIIYGIGESRQTFLLSPVGTPDPRKADGKRCADGAQIRLQIGDLADTHMASGEISLYETIDGQTDIDAYLNRVNVVAGPLCIDRVAWWQVKLLDDPDSIAWTPEMFSNGTYLLSPINPSDDSATLVCQTAYPSRLSSGAFVSANPDAEVTLYASPDESSAVVITLSSEDIYQISSESVCKNGVLWWYVTHADFMGWAIEVNSDGYLLEPGRRVELSDRLQQLSTSG